jgi:hypothetical protein
MKKVISIVLCLFLVVILASCGDNSENKEEDDFNTEENVIGKTFIYEGEGLQGDDFKITINEDNTFSYYEGAASSHLGVGTWSQEGNIITLVENDSERKNSFEISDTQLIWQENNSDNFIYVKLTDGEVFQLTE